MPDPSKLPSELPSELHILFLHRQIEQDLGLPDFADAPAAEAHAGALLGVYADAAPLSEGLDPRDRGAGDELVGLAADALLAPRAAGADRTATLRAMLQVCIESAVSVRSQG